ncbi:GNAT family N-acetyltransferase [Elioraea sp.]|uniref:GNAT family N-acetyltransferase n=1 Tax=Elioraea sp. TaxID=2185103 RepID=UPI0025C23DCC|nr:GNAT family N-acetyltransferase [Elioraea sp.]
MIRPLTGDDRDAVAALWHALYADHARRESPVAGFRPDPPRLVASITAWLGRILAGDEGFALVAASDGKVAGFVAGFVRDQAWLDPPAIGVIGALMVAPTHRRQGLARALVRAAEQRFAADGIGVVEAAIGEANRGARRFWKAEGYGTVRHVVARGPRA